MKTISEILDVIASMNNNDYFFIGHCICKQLLQFRVEKHELRYELSKYLNQSFEFEIVKTRFALTIIL